jgi:hypothetical protein
MTMNMSEDEKHEFPHWEELYQQQEIESMPWFNPELDDDLENARDELELRTGSALDLGTGPGTQATEKLMIRKATAEDFEEIFHIINDAATALRRPLTKGRSRQIGDMSLI